MPLLLYTYIATEILAPFFASFLIINAVLFLGRFVPIFSLILDFGINGWDFLRICAYLLPKLLLFSLPMAGMAAVVVGITRMVNDGEIMALKASGLGLKRLIPPVLFVALATSLFAWFSAVNLIPASSRAMKSLFLQMAREKIDKGLSPGRFSEGLGKTVLYVDSVDGQSKEWRGVYLSDLRHGASPITVVARTGSLTARPDEMLISLALNDGSMHKTGDRLSQTIRFDRYQISLPFSVPVEAEGAAGAGKSDLDQEQLLAKAQEYGSGSGKGLGLLIEYHSRMALPAGGFILTMLGLPLAMLARPGGRAFGLPLALLIFVLYYVLFSAGRAAAESGQLPVAIGVWLADFLLALFTLALTRQVARESLPFWLTRAADRLNSLRARLPWTSSREANP